MRLINLVGKQFSRLTVIKRAKSHNGHTMWQCKCSCGNQSIVDGSNLKLKQVQSCGCLGIESRFKHGMSRSPEYLIWDAMVQRCTNKNSQVYSYYGGRGIAICDRWLSFKNFYADMGARPSDDLSIDRIDNDENYEPSNCRWATKSQQMKNQRLNSKNTSGIRGVCYVKRNNKWCAYIGNGKANIHLGFFNTIDEAADARVEAEIKYWT